MRRVMMIAAAVVAVAAMPAGAVNLVQNGSFEQTTNGLGQFDYRTQAVGWTSSGYNYLFDGNNPTDNVQGSYGGLALWGPGNGSNNGLSASPFGGNFVGADGAFQVGAISQTLTGLTAGHKYAIDFAWGGAQQLGFNGDQTEQWEVQFGSQSQFTAVYHNPSHGFSGWMSEHFVFTADGATDVLSFIAHGTPDGVPPFSLLDGVSGTAVPEPASWALMIGGLGLVGAVARSRRSRVVAA